MQKLKALVAGLMEEDPEFLAKRRSRSRTVTPGSSRRATPKSKLHQSRTPKSTPEVLRAKTLTMGEECAMAKTAGWLFWWKTGNLSKNGSSWYIDRYSIYRSDQYRYQYMAGFILILWAHLDPLHEITYAHSVIRDQQVLPKIHCNCNKSYQKSSWWRKIFVIFFFAPFMESRVPAFCAGPWFFLKLPIGGLTTLIFLQPSISHPIRSQGDSSSDQHAGEGGEHGEEESPTSDDCVSGLPGLAQLGWIHPKLGWKNT